MGLITLFTLLFINFNSNAELYKYSELEIKGYDQILTMVKKRIKKATEIDMAAQKQAELDDVDEYNSQKSIEILRDALRLVLSRPNKDNLVEKLIPQLRSELKSYGAYYDSYHDLAVEAVVGIDQKISVVYRSTYIFVLENIMSELKPLLKSNDEVKKIFYYIRDSKVKIPDDVRLDRKLRSMFKSRSPSETAKVIIKQVLPETKSNKKKKGFWSWLFGG